MHMRNPLDVKVKATEEHPGGGRHMTAGNLLLVLSAVALAATGQLMLKHGMQLATARARGSERGCSQPWAPVAAQSGA